MNTIGTTPLGLSDLSDNEALLIAIFRDWNCSKLDQLAVENKLLNCFQDDWLYLGLQHLFEFFKTLPHQIENSNYGSSSLLSLVEEAILDEIGSDRPIQKRSVEAFRAILNSISIEIRPTAEIPRSGHDQLKEQVNIGALNVYRIMHFMP